MRATTLIVPSSPIAAELPALKSLLLTIRGSEIHSRNRCLLWTTAINMEIKGTKESEHRFSPRETMKRQGG